MAIRVMIANPVVAAAGAVVAACGGRRGGRSFGLLSAAQTAIAVVGFVEHSRGILTAPGDKLSLARIHRRS